MASAWIAPKRRKLEASIARDTKRHTLKESGSTTGKTGKSALSTRGYTERDRESSIKVVLAGVLLLFIMGGLSIASYNEEPRWETLANAIYKAENSPSYPYGVMRSFKDTTPRQACINTCKHAWRDWLTTDKSKPYLEFLSERYCPPNSKVWLKNVRWFYEQS